MGDWIRKTGLPETLEAINISSLLKIIVMCNSHYLKFQTVKISQHSILQPEVNFIPIAN